MRKKVVIVGGGIIGLCCAYYLNEEGHEVVVIDKSNIQSGASFVNAGYLVPSHIIPLAAPGMINQGIRYMFNTSSAFYMKPRMEPDFLKWAWYFKKSSTAAKVKKAIPVIKDINLLSKELYFAIKASGDLGDFHLEKQGLLMVYQTTKYEEAEAKTAERVRAFGLEVRHLDSEAIKALQPDRELHALGAYHYLCDAHTTPGEFMNGMTAFLSKAGVQIHRNETVKSFTVLNNRITGIVTDKGNFDTDEVILAAGSWSAGLAKKLAVPLPLQAGKGYCIDIEESTGIRMPTLLCEAKIAVTPMSGCTRFAGTMEFSGINSTIRRERVAAIIKGVEQYYKGFRIPEQYRERAKYGLRPVSPDGLPYIGRVSTLKNLLLATGHAMMGWSLGPVTGKLISELVSEKKLSLDISPFHPERKF